MPPTSPTLRVVAPRPRRPQRSTFSERDYLAALEADSHHSDVQQIIREAIRLGGIRVRPMPGCPHRVTVVPAPGGRATPSTTSGSHVRPG
jgi:hypothetical protein